MRPGLRTKRVVFALIGGMLISGYAWAVNPGKVNVKNSYYSDASLTTRVGERDYNCQGNLYSWGYQTMGGLVCGVAAHCVPVGDFVARTMDSMG